jgi:hypothetical protein
VAVTSVKDTLSGLIISTGTLRIGSYPNGDAINARIDEVAIWETELDPSEVTEIWNSGAPGDLSSHSEVANLVHWWRMGDFDTYKVLADSIGFAHGKMTNMASGDIVADVP